MQLNHKKNYRAVGGAFALAALAFAGIACQSQQASLIDEAELFRQPLADGSNAVASTGGGAISGRGGQQGNAQTISLNSGDAVKITQLTTRLISSSHYTQHKIDDEISSLLLDRYMDQLDPQHLYFTQQDVQEFEKYRTQLDDLLLKGDATPAQEIFTRFRQRLNENTTYATEELKNDTFAFTNNDTFTLDRKKLPRPSDANAQKELWKQRLRYEYLQEKLNKQTPEQIVKTLNRRYERNGRAIREYDSDDVLELYLTTLAHTYDPHSDYFGRATNENFNIQMRLSLVGIGAQLQSEDGYVKIMELTPGGPAQKSKLLKPGDRIVAVAQEKGEPVDVVDMKIDKVVEMIRGPKNSKVLLTIIPADAPDTSTRRVVTIPRDEIKLEDSAAKARIIETPGKNGQMQRIGYIDLPSFYADPEKGKSATADVALLLKKLKEQKVTGVILDLRRNGGGSLNESISLTGLFIKQGPVVQVRNPDGAAIPYLDDDKSVAYDGPLVVMTSRLTASASEITAGALQDYKRALIVGDSSTFGKGTVQAVIDLSDLFQRAKVETTGDPGSVKLTIQKFYRPSGASTQLRGVVPDIILPSVTNVLDVAEKSLDGPLKWDSISAVPYTVDDRVSPYLTGLKAKSATRIASDKDFVYLRQQIAETKEIVTEKTVSLNEAKRRAEKQKAEAEAKARKAELAARVDNQRFYTITLADAAKPGLPPAQTAKQLAEANRRPDRAKSDDDDAESDPTNATPERDILLDETERIVADFATAARGTVTARK